MNFGTWTESRAAATMVAGGALARRAEAKGSGMESLRSTRTEAKCSEMGAKEAEAEAGAKEAGAGVGAKEAEAEAGAEAGAE